MLINLSSNGELDPAKFSNSFSEGMVIKPNSFVCLVSASVVEDLNNTVITIAANTFVTLRQNTTLLEVKYDLLYIVRQQPKLLLIGANMLLV